MKRLSIIPVLMLWVCILPLAAVAEPLVLLCEYSTELSQPTNESVLLKPREIVIDQIQRAVSWNGTVKNVPVKVEETRFSFTYQGYVYSISRTSGEIRFHNPEKLRNWRQYTASMTADLIGMGESLSTARREASAGQHQAFSGREHVGQCTPSSASPKF